ncbi:MAG: hypothetical protein KGK17_01955 [Betaproteobacteria bacterium]|nr:hypothetical protein [Betaproteobacteria bacterium]
MQFTSGSFNAKLIRELEKEYQFGREVGEAFLRVHNLVGKLLANLNGGLGTLDHKSALTLIDNLESHYPGMNDDEYNFMASSIFLCCYCDFELDDNGEEEMDGLPLVEVIDLVLFHEMDKPEPGAVMFAAPDASKYRQ